MMKKMFYAASVLLAFSLTAGAAYAAPGNGNGHGNDKKQETSVSATVVVDASKGKSDDKGNSNSNGNKGTVTGDTYGSDKGHNGYKGLLNAIENVKDKPAGAVLAEILLTKYESKLTAEQKAELEAIQEKDAALSKVAELLAAKGSVTEAVYAQKDAVKANIKNIDSYKKLGKLYDQLGKTGVKLYVNGDEPTFEVAPFIRDGSTLVPFRAISEALKAEVSWNGEERSVTVTRDGISVKLFIGSTTAMVNGKEVTLEVPAAIADGSTVVPVRFVSEALKATVKWESETQSVVVYEE